MNETLTDLIPTTPQPALPALPEPAQRRWQPLRVGLIELFHYDSEEFWFRDGHLLLRGNNGTGKSKVLSLTLPFLFDAQLKSARIEPDGDAGKKMAWNLLLGKHERRIGYTWIEFGRINNSGQAEYLTLGCGLAAVAARATVDSWFFLVEQRRHGRDFWLISPQRAVLTKDRLKDAIEGSGWIFETAAAYRRAVDERLFHLGEVRYAALMDTLIQLRQPQLSKRPNEDSLSDALTEALPPLSADLLGDVADAMNQLEEYRQQLTELSALRKAIEQFNRRYRVYAAIRARREARAVRTAQTGFDYASRDLNEAKAALEEAQRDESERKSMVAQLDSGLLRDRAALEELAADPVMRDARRLEETERNAAERKRDVLTAESALQNATQRLQREGDATREAAARAERAQQAVVAALVQLTPLAQNAGIAAEPVDPADANGDANSDDYMRATRLFADPHLLAQADTAHLRAMQQALRELAVRRREHLAQIQRRLRAVESTEREYGQEQRRRNERADELEDAAAQAAAAELAAEQCGAALVDRWQRHCAGLQQLHLPDADLVLTALAEWVATLDGDNPARAALHRAQQQASARLAEHEAELRQQRKNLGSEQSILQSERESLERGEDKTPPAPYQRSGTAREGRAGAPLWQLIEFRERVSDTQRAGLEAALEAAGLLDAWLTPDGALLAADTFDTILIARTSQPASLTYWCVPVEGAVVPAAVITWVLRGIACADNDVERAEAWVAPSGQFRLGPVCGAWDKPIAEYIGYAAREAARQRRLVDVLAALDAIARQLQQLQAQQNRVAQQQRMATEEWEQAPSDDALRGAQIEAIGFEKQRRAAAEKLAHADALLIAAERRWRDARESLAVDAEDLRLPTAPQALAQIERALDQYEQALQTLMLEAQNVRHTLPEFERQREREAEARAELDARNAQLTERSALADEIAARLQVLRETVGVKVEELKQRLAAIRQAVLQGEQSLKSESAAMNKAGEQRARSEQRVEDCGVLLEERSSARHTAISGLQRFAATGLLALALPDLEQPAQGEAWTIDAALSLARRTEQELLTVNAEDADWTRIQNAVSGDFTELTRTLTALGHQAQAEMSDYGPIVAIVYQNRPERPDLIEHRIAEEIAQRRELLTQREREVLENHLQAEVAAAVQRLLQDSERRLAAINDELEKRPTSTGVKFRLVWQALPEGSEGAPIGLDAARKRLLNTSADAWSPDDRKVVGDMLQNRIAAERLRADMDGGGSLLDMLSRALDYRRWHRFRVQRWQDGQWRPLSGPASSGERALGLTVPLFAAVSSFYSHGDYAYAPRLVLLDEAFAGIDDAARAHCMALVREFDLDFVMTSEREWACYAELPGVSICQLQRHEGIDAVYVSRWTWDGRARRAEADGARRFPALAA